MIKINPHIFRAYDIRGIAMGNNPDLTPEAAYFIGKATGKYLKDNFGTTQGSAAAAGARGKTAGKYFSRSARVIIGRDARLTSEILQTACMHGLIDAGCEVKNAGLATSPMIYWATCAMDFDGGIMLTASHNPKEYNGIKIVGKGAHSVCGEELQKILKITELYAHEGERSENAVGAGMAGGANAVSGTNSASEMFPETNMRKLREEPIAKNYIDDLLHRAKLDRKLKIVVDAGNGVAGPFIKDLFEKFGCEVIPLFCEPDGNFPNHEANPEYEKNLAELIETVRAEKADLGFGFDGDGDRIGVVDETGKLWPGDYVLMFLAKDLLTRHPNAKVIFDTKASQVAINEVAKSNGKPIISVTGHSFMEVRMRQEKALIGGEISGHTFFAENYYGFDDAFLAAMKVMEIVSRATKKFSEYFADVPAVYSTSEIKAYCPDNKKFQIVKEVTDYFTKKYDCLTIDGVRVKFDENSWAAVRCSNTTPNLTIRFESPDKKTFEEMRRIFYEKLSEYPEVDLSWYGTGSLLTKSK
ncbi:phosphomannomutase/phosphoglucomutase [Candidatus Peregrinibacteria bacterium]|nr:phosphomannomutase/phosphoglucomutase [Candidatus Peregrinibacteria bacterium]